MSKSGLLDYLEKATAILPEEQVEIPEWGGRKITLRGFTSRERDLWEAGQVRRANAKAGNGSRRAGVVEPDFDNFRARVVAHHIVEGGQRTFANPRGEEVLGDQPAAILDRLFTISQRLSGFSKEDVDELVGNSVATGAVEASSASPASSAAPSPSSNGGSASAS